MSQGNTTRPPVKGEKGYLRPPPESLHQPLQLALLVKGTVADIDVDKNTVGGGADTGEEAAQGRQAASKVDAFTSADREGLAGSDGG